MIIDPAAEDSEERRKRESAEHRANIVAMNTEIAESALERAFVDWWLAPPCKRAGGACGTGHPNCKVDGKRTAMCARFREHLARAVGEIM